MSLIMVQKNTERKMKIYLLTSYVIEILGNEAKILQKLIHNFWIVRIARNSRDQKQVMEKVNIWKFYKRLNSTSGFSNLADRRWISKCAASMPKDEQVTLRLSQQCIPMYVLTYFALRKNLLALPFITSTFIFLIFSFPP